jgi:DNA-binding MarR family transcriptional regulator
MVEAMKELVLGLRGLASADVFYNAAVADRLGVSATDLRCLSRIDELGSASPGELARWSGLTSGAVTGVVDRLVRAGLVRREPDPGDARRVRVLPVPEQRARVEELMAPLGARLAAAARRLSADQQQALTEFVADAHRAMIEEMRRLRLTAE